MPGNFTSFFSTKWEGPQATAYRLHKIVALYYTEELAILLGNKGGKGKNRESLFYNIVKTYTSTKLLYLGSL